MTEALVSDQIPIKYTVFMADERVTPEMGSGLATLQIHGDPGKAVGKLKTGGVRAAAWMGGGYVPAPIRGTRFEGLISVADW